MLQTNASRVIVVTDPQSKHLFSAKYSTRTPISPCNPFQHLGFVHCPIREHCPAFPHCTDAIVERTVSKRVSRPASWLVDTNHLNIILLGKILNNLNIPILPCNLGILMQCCGFFLTTTTAHVSCSNVRCLLNLCNAIQFLLCKDTILTAETIHPR